MRKQIFLASAVSAVFILAAATASFAADRRGHHRDYRQGYGKHFAAKPHSGHWKRGFAPRHSRGWWNSRRAAPRHRWLQRAPHHRPRFQAPRHPYGPRRGDRREWREGPSNHYRPGHSVHRPSARYDNTGQNLGRRDRSDRWHSDGTAAVDGGVSTREGRHNGGRQRPL